MAILALAVIIQLTKNTANIPADIKPRMKTYSEENIIWMKTLLDKTEDYYVRYADDIVWIVSEKDDVPEYVYVINQN